MTFIHAPVIGNKDCREVGLLLCNAGEAAKKITHGMRFAQTVVALTPPTRFGAVPGFPESLSGTGDGNRTGVF